MGTSVKEENPSLERSRIMIGLLAFIGCLLIPTATGMILFAMTNPPPPQYGLMITRLHMPDFVVQDFEVLGSIIMILGAAITGLSLNLFRHFSTKTVESRNPNR